MYRGSKLTLFTDSSVRAAPPLSTWDAPEPQDRGFNRFARRENTKAARAAEYWASNCDEYALPHSSDAPRSFTSARAANRPYQHNPSSPKPPAPPPARLAPSNHKLPEPLPFTFGANDHKRPDTDLGMFTNSSSSSLAMMKSLGLPGDESPASSPILPSVAGFQSAATDSMSGWKNLGPPDVGEKPLEAAVSLAKGTKRLGMGRPAPWGAKKPRPE